MKIMVSDNPTSFKRKLLQDQELRTLSLLAVAVGNELYHLRQYSKAQAFV